MKFQHKGYSEALWVVMPVYDRDREQFAARTCYSGEPVEEIDEVLAMIGADDENGVAVGLSPLKQVMLAMHPVAWWLRNYYGLPRLLLDRENFNDCNLVGIDAEGALLHYCSFLRAKLGTGGGVTPAHFREASLAGCRFNYAEMRGVRLGGAQAQSAHFGCADMRSVIAESANFTLAKMEYADLRNAKLRAACFTMADLRGVDLRDADIRQTNFEGARRLAEDHALHGWALREKASEFFLTRMPETP